MYEARGRVCQCSSGNKQAACLLGLRSCRTLGVGDRRGLRDPSQPGSYPCRRHALCLVCGSRFDGSRLVWHSLMPLRSVDCSAHGAVWMQQPRTAMGASHWKEPLQRVPHYSLRILVQPFMPLCYWGLVGQPNKHKSPGLCCDRLPSWTLLTTTAACMRCSTCSKGVDRCLDAVLERA